MSKYHQEYVFYPITHERTVKISILICHGDRLETGAGTGKGEILVA